MVNISYKRENISRYKIAIIIFIIIKCSCVNYRSAILIWKRNIYNNNNNDCHILKSWPLTFWNTDLTFNRKPETSVYNSLRRYFISVLKHPEIEEGKGKGRKKENQEKWEARAKSQSNNIESLEAYPVYLWISRWRDHDRSVTSSTWRRKWARGRSGARRCANSSTGL